MKQTYHRSDFLRSRKKMIALAVIFAVGVSALVIVPVRNALTRGAYVFVPALLEKENSITQSLKNITEGFIAAQSLADENRRIKEETLRMQAQVLDRNLLEERVAELEGLLGREWKDGHVVARVLAGPGRSPYDTLIVDAGKEQGISQGDPVAYAGAGIIGNIDEVYAQAAKVRLFSSSGVHTAVIVGERAVPGIAEGRGMGNFEVQVPKGSAVLVGDTVMLPGGTLILGMVGTAIEDDAAPFARVLFAAPFNIAEIRTVEVIKTTYN